MVNSIISDQEVMQWLPCSDQVSTYKELCGVALGFMNDFIKPWDEFGFGVWAMSIRDPALGASGDFIGYCGFLPGQIEGAGPELSHGIGNSMWGKWLATEALTACLD
jgi:RimJ/RimL family protein N-acetyltransferase